MAEGLAEIGADLVLCARKKERAEQAAGELGARGVRARSEGKAPPSPSPLRSAPARGLNGRPEA